MNTQCCVVGGGPAGMMLGFLLARAGVEVVVLEKHADFLRDFRGDTIHPSTLELMYELGLLTEFLQRPHNKIYQAAGKVGDDEFVLADFAHLPTHCGYIALMPQWEFLNFLAEHAQRYPTFTLKMQTEAVDLLEEDGKVVGVKAKSPEGPLEIRAPLTVACDGRHSVMRADSGLEVIDLGAPIDVLWMRLSRRADDPKSLVGRFDRGRAFIMIDRHDYWQCAYVIHKGGDAEIRQRGLDAFRQDIVQIAPFLADRVGELTDWNQVKLLTVSVDRLKQWYRPGLLCIGDAAHAMSPVGGVGINLAIQDAVATANRLFAPLLDGHVALEDLAAVQRRREAPTRWTQKLQVFLHERFLSKVIGSDDKAHLPTPVKMLLKIPMMRRIPARAIGLGLRPEHIYTPDAVEPVEC